MLKKLLSVVLTALLINLAAGPAYSHSQDDEQARRIEKIKENVRKLGVGTDARAEVKLQDGRTLKGYIREATDDSFIMVEQKTGIAISVTYLEVAQLKGKNSLTAAKVGITVAKGVGVVAAVAAIFTLFLYLVIPKT